jgi:hypothetical protein
MALLKSVDEHGLGWIRGTIEEGATPHYDSEPSTKAGFSGTTSDSLSPTYISLRKQGCMDSCPILSMIAVV